MKEDVREKEYCALCLDDVGESWEEIRTASDAKVYFHRASGEQYCKVYPRVEGIKRLKELLKGTPVRRAVIKQRLLASHGFASPKILTCGRHNKRYYLVTKSVDGLTLGAYLRNYRVCSNDKQSFREKRRLLRHLASSIANMHGKGLRYGDLNASNILVSKDLDHFVYLDYEATRRFYFRVQKHIERNLQQLNACDEPGLTRTDRYFFLKHYQCCLGEKFDIRCEALARHVLQRTLARKKRKVSEKFS